MRLAGWSESLFEFVESRKTTPFEWGGHDCSLFSADGAIAVCGVDYAAPVRGYTSRQGAEAIIASYGGMVPMVNALMGRLPIAAAMARRGDAVLAVIAGSETLGICLGNVCAFAQIGAGVALLPRTVAAVAWRVG